MVTMWLYSPEKIDIKGSSLVSVPTVEIKKKSKLINKASELSVLLRRVFVHKSFDPPEKLGWFKNPKGEGTTNDLLIVTEYQAGKNPNVQRFHSFLMNRKKRILEGPFGKSTVCSFSDFNGQYLLLKPRIYDMDHYDGIISGIDQASKVLDKFAGLFPVFGSAIIKTATPIAKAIFQLVDALDTNEQIIDQTLRLYVKGKSAFRGGAGFDLLQTGHYVCFSKEPKKELKLTRQRKILLSSSGKEYKASSYVIYSIVKKASEEPEEEIDQKVANLLSELNGDGKDRTKKAVEFLSETIDGYNNFKKLNRINELTAKPEKKLSTDEKNLLKKLQKDKKIKTVISDIAKAKTAKPKRAKHKPLRDFVIDVTKRMQEELDVLEKKWGEGKLKVNHKKYEKMRKDLINEYKITRKKMKELTKKYYSRTEKNEAFRRKLPKLNKW